MLLFLCLFVLGGDIYLCLVCAGMVCWCGVMCEVWGARGLRRGGVICAPLSLFLEVWLGVGWYCLGFSVFSVGGVLALWFRCVVSGVVCCGCGWWGGCWCWL